MSKAEIFNRELSWIRFNSRVLDEAANMENPLLERGKFLSICAELGYPPQHGRFGADMKVESINDGPVTLILDTDQLMDTPRH